jgi:hypothetical protein
MRRPFRMSGIVAGTSIWFTCFFLSMMIDGANSLAFHIAGAHIAGLDA